MLLGSVERTVPWFVRARRMGLLRGARLVVTNQLNLTPAQLEQIDRVIVYASVQAAALGPKGVFLPLPADGDFEAARGCGGSGDYVFAGGGAGRDFATLVEAVRGTDVRLQLVVIRAAPGWRSAVERRRARPGAAGPLPRTDGGRSVRVIPLVARDSPHGQTTLVQALALGLPIVATRSVGIVDYVEDGEKGYLVEPGDVGALRRRSFDSSRTRISTCDARVPQRRGERR